MEHYFDEQHSISDAGQQITKSESTEDRIAHGSIHSVLLNRLGLGNEFLSSRADEGQLRAALSSPIWSLRAAAVQSLGKLGERSPLEVLVNALDDENRYVRAAAARALGTMGERTPLEPLLNALHDKEWRVRAAAAYALGALYERAPVESLVTALTDEDESVRAAAASSISAFKEQAPIEPLVDALHDSAWNVREAAALALGELGKRAPLENLLAALSDTDASVRAAVKMALLQTHPEVCYLPASSIINPLLEEDLASIADVMVLHQSTTIEGPGLNGHHKSEPALEGTASFSKMDLPSPDPELLHEAPEQSNWSDSNYLQEMSYTGIPQAGVLSRPVTHAARPHVLQKISAVILLFWNHIVAHLKIISHMLSPAQKKESSDSMVTISVVPLRQPLPRRFLQVVQVSLVLVIGSIIFASATLFQAHSFNMANPVTKISPYVVESSLSPGEYAKTGIQTTTANPYIAYNSLSPGDCSITALGWLCNEVLTVPPNATESLDWTATSSSKQVNFNPSGGILFPGQSLQVSISIPTLDCKNDIFRFVGPKYNASVTWTCIVGPSPKQLSPRNGSVFNNYPRTTTLRWTAVAGAISYSVQIYYYQPGDTTCTDGTLDRKIAGNTEASYTFDFIGAQPGCWQVWAVDKYGYQIGSKSPLWEFSYIR